MTDQAETVLKAVQTVENRYNTGFSTAVYGKLLCGIKDKIVGAWHMEELPCFGDLARLPEDQIRDLLEQMKLQGLLKEVYDGKFSHLTLGPAATEVLDYGQQVRIRRKLLPKVAVLRAPALPPDEDLLSALRNLRSRLSKQANIPAYQIFSNATLEDMARKAPTTLDAFLQVNGVGQMKAHKYAGPFLEVIRGHGLK